jgi:hypothetical protein
MSRVRGDFNRASRCCKLTTLRGREAVRAQSAILDKSNPKPSLFLSITVFLVRMVSIRTKNTVGARERATASEIV